MKRKYYYTVHTKYGKFSSINIEWTDEECDLARKSFAEAVEMTIYTDKGFICLPKAIIQDSVFEIVRL